MPAAVIAAAVVVAGVNHAEQARRNAEGDYAVVARVAHGLRAADEPIVALGVPVLPLAFYLHERVAELPTDPPRAAESSLLIADAGLVGRPGADVTVAATKRLGRHTVVVARVGGSLTTLATPAPAPMRGAAAARGMPSRHVAVELLCVIVALAALVARGVAIRHASGTGVVYACEATIILALASFPGHPLVFGGGVLLAAVCGYVRWRRAPTPAPPQLLAGALLVLALPLDVLDDVLRGEPVKADPVWMVAALLGVGLITWHRLSRASA
jgi:hypothetical protein